MQPQAFSLQFVRAFEWTIGDTLHAFDLLEVDGNDLRQRRYIDRHSGLVMLIPPGRPALRWVPASVTPADKAETYEDIRINGGEGVVFKDMDAPFSPGHPNSGGTQLKFKFVETASCIVDTHNGKRSVALTLLDNGRRVNAGNVTIPANHGIPSCGDVVEGKYLDGYRECGSLYQPVYLGRRDDIPPGECTVNQLKYKAESAAA